MRLFWKIFLSVITVTLAVFCISGHILIAAFFVSSLKAEIELGVRSNISICRSFESGTVRKYGTETLTRSKVQYVMSSVSISTVQENVQFLIKDQEGRTLYKTLETGLREKDLLLEAAEQDATVYVIENVRGRYYLNCAGISVIGENSYIVQNVSDITYIYEQKTMQYNIFAGCIGILVVLTAAAAFGISARITLPIQKLSRAAKKIGAGDYKRRIALRGNDEITDLAREFNRMSARLEESVAELKDAAQRQESFTGSFAHEMKTPLTSIIGYSDMLRSKPLTEEERMIYGDYIYQQGKRLENLSHKMLELIVLKKTDFEMKKVSLKKLFLTIKEELAPVLGERGIRLRIDAEDLQLVAEPELIKTVFLNFLDNSIKAVGADGVIRICAVRTEEGVEVTVADNGKGIPQKDLKRVTESFYMADRSRKYENGSVGLGLSICKRILELHQASMQIESEEGRGTKIKVIFGRQI